MKANTATQPKFFSGHREVFRIWTWVPFCWVFTERLKFQCVCLPLTAVQSTAALFSKKNEAIHQLRIFQDFSLMGKSKNNKTVMPLWPQWPSGLGDSSPFLAHFLPAHFSAPFPIPDSTTGQMWPEPHLRARAIYTDHLLENLPWLPTATEVKPSFCGGVQGILSRRNPPVFFLPSSSHNTSFLAKSFWALWGSLIAVSWYGVGVVWTQIAKYLELEAQSLVRYC